jgi:hypothetical protein
LIRRGNTILHRIPGANRTYEVGDGYAGGHYLHLFQSEEEVRRELVGAGTLINELHWLKGFAVVTFPRQI